MTTIFETTVTLVPTFGPADALLEVELVEEDGIAHVDLFETFLEGFHRGKRRHVVGCHHFDTYFAIADVLDFVSRVYGIETHMAMAA